MVNNSSRPILFDLDGTLVESGPSIMTSIRHALGQVKGPELDEPALRSFIGPPLRVSFRDIAGLHGQQLEDALEIYIAHQLKTGIDMVVPYDGIPQLLAELRAARVPLAVATSKRTENAFRVLEHTELLGFFEIVSGSEPGRMEKRHSIETARVGLAAADVALDDALMIGDRIHDIDGAAHFEMDCIAVTWGYGTADEWARADEVVESVPELRDRLLAGI